MMNEIDTHAPAPSAATGWLRVLCLLLIVWEPIGFAAAAAAAFNAIAVRGVPVVAVLAVRLVATALAVAAGRALQDGKPAGVQLGRLALALSGSIQVIALVTPWFPSNRLPGETPLYAGAVIAYYGAWLTYLQRSRRIKSLLKSA